MVSIKYGRHIIIISAVEEVMVNGLGDGDIKRCDRASKGIYTRAVDGPCVDLQLLRREEQREWDTLASNLGCRLLSLI